MYLLLSSVWFVFIAFELLFCTFLLPSTFVAKLAACLSPTWVVVGKRGESPTSLHLSRGLGDPSLPPTPSSHQGDCGTMATCIVVNCAFSFCFSLLFLWVVILDILFPSYWLFYCCYYPASQIWLGQGIWKIHCFLLLFRILIHRH